MSHFCVYKISSNIANSVYYGYYEGEDVLQSFLKGAQRTYTTDFRRGAVDWLQENGGDTDNIIVDIVDVCGDEMDAWCMRNDHRARDCSSITGPSNWPANIASRVNNEHPERVSNWKHNKQINESETARRAYKLGAFIWDDIKQLSVTFEKTQIVYDLDHLSPQEFSVKYNLPITYQ